MDSYKSILGLRLQGRYSPFLGASMAGAIGNGSRIKSWGHGISVTLLKWGFSLHAKSEQGHSSLTIESYHHLSGVTLSDTQFPPQLLDSLGRSYLDKETEAFAKVTEIVLGKG